MVTNIMFPKLYGTQFNINTDGKLSDTFFIVLPYLPGDIMSMNGVLIVNSLNSVPREMQREEDFNTIKVVLNKNTCDIEYSEDVDNWVDLAVLVKGNDVKIICTYPWSMEPSDIIELMNNGYKFIHLFYKGTGLPYNGVDEVIRIHTDYQCYLQYDGISEEDINEQELIVKCDKCSISSICPNKK